jgi:hypothetical protein
MLVTESISHEDEMVGHVARMGDMYTKCWSKNVKGRDHSEDLGVDKRILEWILWELCGKVCIWLRIGISGGFL